jgi:hypothetical protein
MGTTPQPPGGSASPVCTQALTCSAVLHYVGCERALADVRKREAVKECSNQGHEWTVHRVWDGDTPFAATCERCGKRLRMVEDQ